MKVLLLLVLLTIFSTASAEGCYNVACGCPPYTSGADWCSDFNARISHDGFCELNADNCQNSCGHVFCADQVATCSRPTDWCIHQGATYEERDCDGDLVKDHYCVDSLGNKGVIGSANGCNDSWPTGVCIDPQVYDSCLEYPTEEEQIKCLKDEVLALEAQLAGVQNQYNQVVADESAAQQTCEDAKAEITEALGSCNNGNN